MATKRTPSDPKKAVLYWRASKEEQKLSPDVQRAAAEQWAAREGVELVGIFGDHLSSVTAVEDRPGLVAALDALKATRAGIFLVAKRDRIGRDVVLVAMITRMVEREGAQVVSAAGEGNGDTPSDKLMRSIIDAFASYERDIIRSRTKAALAAKKAKGERVGLVPYGYRLHEDGKHMVADEGEQRMIATIRSLKASGLSQRKIAAQLAADGVRSRKGTPLLRIQIHRILHREVAP
jgi:DNA invertase Pin-like site-specific DNA recombinase